MPEKKNHNMKQDTFTVILFYTFAKIKNPESFRDKQRKIAEACNLKGRMLVPSKVAFTPS
jgi:predicted sulfurtransferase